MPAHPPFPLESPQAEEEGACWRDELSLERQPCPPIIAVPNPTNQTEENQALEWSGLH